MYFSVKVKRGMVGREKSWGDGLGKENGFGQEMGLGMETADHAADALWEGHILLRETDKIPPGQNPPRT